MLLRAITIRLHMISIVALIASTQFAQANCWNNEDRSSPIREFTTCFDGKCIDDELLLVCGGTLGFWAKFSGGFRVLCESEVTGSGYSTVSQASNCKYFLGDYELSQQQTKLLSCTPKDPDEYGCDWFPDSNGE